MLKIINTTKFKSDIKKFKHKANILKEFKTVLNELINHNSLEKKYRDHPLVGNWKGRRECHLAPDVLLIYKIKEDTLILERIGSHSDLFK